MLQQVQRSSKSYGAKRVLSNVSVVVEDGEHVGRVGLNRTGKSTLLRCTAGRERPDTGTVVVTSPGATVGYLTQTFDPVNDLAVGEVIAAAQTEWTDAARALKRATVEKQFRCSGQPAKCTACWPPNATPMSLSRISRMTSVGAGRERSAASRTTATRDCDARIRSAKKLSRTFNSDYNWMSV